MTELVMEKGGIMAQQSQYTQPSAQTLRIVEELRGGRSYRELSKQYGLTRQRIGQIAKRHGLTRNEIPIDSSIAQSDFSGKDEWSDRLHIISL